jgi:tetratricopeptide (TPR) repeat protein
VESEPTRKVEAWDDVIRWIVTLSAAYIPLLISPITFDTFGLPKASALYMSAIALTTAFLIRSLAAKKFLVGSSPLDLPVLLFMVVAIISVFTSPNPILSIIGQYTFYENLPTIYSFAVLYFMASRFLIKSNHLKRLLSHLVAAFFLISLYGILQYFGLDVRQSFLRTPGEAVGSTLGDPVVLGGYAALMMPIVLNAIIDKSRHSLALELSKPLLMATFALGFTVTVLTQARSSWFGLLVGIVFVLLIRRRELGDKDNGLLVPVGLSMLCAILLTLVVLILPINPQVQAQQKSADSPFSLSKETINIRKELWKSALFMISVRPVSGYGPDQAYNWWSRFQTLKHARLERDTTIDRARNEFLQTAIANGIFGLAAFIWILVASALIAIRGLKDTSNAADTRKKYFYYMVIGGFAAYFAQAFFGIATIGVYSVIWILFGTLAPLRKETPAPQLELSFKLQQLTSVGLLLFAIIALAPVANLLVADFHYFKGALKQNSGNLSSAANEYATAIQFNKNQTTYRKSLALLYFEQGKKTNNPRLIQQGMNIIEPGLILNPADSSLMINMAAGYRMMASFSKENSLFGSAELYYGQAIESCPGFIAPRRAMLAMFLVKENYEKAIDEALAILRIDPGDAEVKYRLGLAYEKTGKVGRAKHLYEEVLKDNPEITEARVALARIR